MGDLQILGFTQTTWIEVFAIPAIGGIVLLIRYFLHRLNGGQIYLLAAIFTLKPLIATPLWARILGSSVFTNPLATSLSVLPGAGLTAIIVIAFRSMYSSRTRKIPIRLLILDCVRWMNTLLALVLPKFGGTLGPFLALMLAIAGFALPSIYAIYALIATQDLDATTKTEART